ncbi:HLB1 [Scenedesmus sp. PABB004]|nr:HLB1 [Scenedesmus sp. PABB004]
MADALAAELEARCDGFKASFGGEELKRACATLSGALIGGALQPPLAALAEDADLHVRELAFAARQYAVATAEQPGDFEGLYNHGLVLQELSGKLPPGSAEQAAMLRTACARYEAALALRPAAHAALYNWGVALSDLARAVKAGSPAEATAALHLASQKYARSLQLHPRNPQALNNWGLVLQELSSDARSWGERDALVRGAMDKFRLALRGRPDFDRGTYNLGTVFYTFAMALQGAAGARRSHGAGGAGAAGARPAAPADAPPPPRRLAASPPPPDAPPSRGAREHAVRGLLAGAAQYIALAHALAPARDIYRKSLSVVRAMLPLPFLRAGHLSAPRARSIGTVTETWRRDWFVLDQHSLRQASSMETSLSTAGAGVPSASQQRAGGGGGGGGDDEPLVLPLRELLAVRRCAEPSLPEGGGIWVSTAASPAGTYLVADDGDAADAWVDALVLCAHLVAAGAADALEEALAPVRRGKHAAPLG